MAAASAGSAVMLSGTDTTWEGSSRHSMARIASTPLASRNVRSVIFMAGASFSPTKPRTTMIRPPMAGA